MNRQQFLQELAKLRPSATFISLLGYRNEYGEIAHYNLLFHMDYAAALRRSIDILEHVKPNTSLEATAKQQLLDGYQLSLDNALSYPIEARNDNYRHFLDHCGQPIRGVKLHISTDTLHLYGLINWKRIIFPGSYPIRNRQELTIAKDNLRRQLPVNKFRQFKISPDRVDKIKVEKLSLLPPTI